AKEMDEAQAAQALSMYEVKPKGGERFFASFLDGGVQVVHGGFTRFGSQTSPGIVESALTSPQRGTAANLAQGEARALSSPDLFDAVVAPGQTASPLQQTRIDARGRVVVKNNSAKQWELYDLREKPQGDYRPRAVCPFAEYAGYDENKGQFVKKQPEAAAPQPMPEPVRPAGSSASSPEPAAEQPTPSAPPNGTAAPGPVSVDEIMPQDMPPTPDETTAPENTPAPESTPAVLGAGPSAQPSPAPDGEFTPLTKPPVIRPEGSTGGGVPPADQVMDRAEQIRREAEILRRQSEGIQDNGPPL
ncbi:MAG TPA: hypothetical protein PLP17_08715, partial [Oligoflexia bacterium]|nr:hypothetical protein [Oligoflexia bacterium]